jgi:hypothetical protein
MTTLSHQLASELVDTLFPLLSAATGEVCSGLSLCDKLTVRQAGSRAGSSSLVLETVDPLFPPYRERFGAFIPRPVGG